MQLTLMHYYVETEPLRYEKLLTEELTFFVMDCSKCEYMVRDLITFQDTESDRELTRVITYVTDWAQPPNQVIVGLEFF